MIGPLARDALFGAGLRKGLGKMTKQEALKILMLSPIYFRLSLAARKSLLDEFCRNLIKTV